MRHLIISLWITLYIRNFLGCLAFDRDDSLVGHLIDGDIMLDVDEDLWDRSHGPLVDMTEKRWPSGVVPYDLNATAYTVWDLYMIREGLTEIEKDTCVRFVRRTVEKDYIFITPFGGCWSYVGRKGLTQGLSLVSPYCINKGTIIHEFMHALGFWHEHTRRDRDQYIEILWQNVVDDEKQVNFAKHFPEAVNFLNFSYDYQSVMHYDAYAFSKSARLPTMKPKKPNVRLRDLGRAKAVGTLTETDKLKLNYLYQCNGR